MTLKVGMQHWVCEYYKAGLNYDPELTLTHFTPGSDLVAKALIHKFIRKRFAPIEAKSIFHNWLLFRRVLPYLNPVVFRLWPKQHRVLFVLRAKKGLTGFYHPMKQTETY